MNCKNHKNDAQIEVREASSREAQTLKNQARHKPLNTNIISACLNNSKEFGGFVVKSDSILCLQIFTWKLTMINNFTLL